MLLSSFRFFRRTSDSADRSQASTLYNAGKLFSSWGRHQRALECYEGVIEMDPGHARAHYGRGATLARLRRYGEALSGFEHALALQPDFIDAWFGRAVSLATLNRHAEAVAAWDRLLALQPEHVDANYGRGICFLALGDLTRGFAGLEHRSRLPHSKKHALRFPSPMWRGDSSLAGKTILLYPDGGLGDAIQFVRYIPMLAKRGARVVLRVPKKLRSLLRGMPFVDRVAIDFEPLPPHDFHCPMMSLPQVFGTTIETIPASCPYLRADARRVEAWARRLGPRRRPRVGISWAGNKLHREYNYRRSIPAEALRPLADLDCELISLQRPVPRQDRAALRAMPWMDRLGESLRDFAEIAAVIENLDLVIAIDSAIAHLAGSLGKPVWLLLCHGAEWRWLTGRTDSPWYPTARLFRQTAPGDWPGVVADVKAAWPQWAREQSSVAAAADESAELCSGRPLW